MFVLAFVMPHGVLEMPAAIIATALAVRLGAALIAPPRGMTVGRGGLQALADFVKLFLAVVRPCWPWRPPWRFSSHRPSCWQCMAAERKPPAGLNLREASLLPHCHLFQRGQRLFRALPSARMVTTAPRSTPRPAGSSRLFAPASRPP